MKDEAYSSFRGEGEGMEGGIRLAVELWCRDPAAATGELEGRDRRFCTVSLLLYSHLPQATPKASCEPSLDPASLKRGALPLRAPQSPFFSCAPTFSHVLPRSPTFSCGSPTLSYCGPTRSYAFPRVPTRSCALPLAPTVPPLIPCCPT